MTKWTNQDGTERRTESYVCSYATKHRGTSVCRRNGVVASQVEDEVMEYTRKIVRNPQFIKGNTAQKEVPNTAKCDIINLWINR